MRALVPLFVAAVAAIITAPATVTLSPLMAAVVAIGVGATAGLATWGLTGAGES